MRNSRLERYKQEIALNPGKMSIYRTKTFKSKKVKKGVKKGYKKGGKKKPKVSENVSVDSFKQDSGPEDITKDDLDQMEDGIGDSPEERPSLKMLKTKVIEAKKPNKRNG